MLWNDGDEISMNIEQLTKAFDTLKYFQIYTCNSQDCCFWSNSCHNPCIVPVIYNISDLLMTRNSRPRRSGAPFHVFFAVVHQIP